MAALSVERARDGKAMGRPRRSASAVKRRRSSELAATPPETTMLWAPKASAAAKVCLRRLPTTAYWKLAMRSRVWWSQERRRASDGFEGWVGGEAAAASFDGVVHVVGLGVAEDGGFDSAEGEVEVSVLLVRWAFGCWSVPCDDAVLDLAEGEGDGAGVAVGGEGVDPGASGVAEAEELGYFVEGFAGGVVYGAAYVAVGPGAFACPAAAR